VRFFPRGFGGTRRDAEQVKQDGWRQQNILVVSPEDHRLTWPERELVKQLGEKLYGGRRAKEARHG
jgi:hypothetical protein